MSKLHNLYCIFGPTGGFMKKYDITLLSKKARRLQRQLVVTQLRKKFNSTFETRTLGGFLIGNRPIG